MATPASCWHSVRPRSAVIWAVAQPWRLTLLHPYGESVMWLLAEPPLYAVIVGLLFRVLIAPSIVEDMRAAE